MSRIAEANGFDSAEPIKRLYRWDEGYWIDEVRNGADVRQLPDNCWVVWTRSEGQIPGRGIKLKEMAMESDAAALDDVDDDVDVDVSISNQEKQEIDSSTQSSSPPSSSSAGKGSSESDRHRRRHQGAMLITEEQYNSVKINAIRLINKCMARRMITMEEAHALVDLVLCDNSYVLALYTNFKSDPETFVRYARKKVKGSASADDGTSGEKEETSTMHIMSSSSTSSNTSPTTTSPSAAAI